MTTIWCLPFLIPIPGIVLLEETLIFGSTEGEGERPAKRARGATGAAVNQLSKDTTTWIELARLVFLALSEQRANVNGMALVP